MPDEVTTFDSPRPYHAVAPRTDNPLAGILLITGAGAIFSVSDVTAKLLNLSLPPLEIAWLRYGSYALLILPLLIHGGRPVWRSRRPWLQAMRGICMFASSVFFISGTRYLPLADATASSFINPVFITMLSVPLLGEHVGIRRWIAVAIGLIGMLIIVRPGGASFQLATILPVLSAVAWALAIVMTRLMAGADNTLTTMAYPAVVGLGLATLALPFDFTMPTGHQILLGFLVGITASAGQWMVVLAYRTADASLLAPFTYSQLLWSTLAGFVVFTALPDAWTFTGAGIIVASSLYTAHRERLHRYRRKPAG